MGLGSPFRHVTDLLFDYPALLDPINGAGKCEWDFLVVNSRPCSGQFMAYDRVEYMTPLIGKLLAKGYSVVTTQKTEKDDEWSKAGRYACTVDHELSISAIGRLSLQCRHHVMVSTGPSWPTFNIWNAPLRIDEPVRQGGRLRLLMLANGEGMASGLNGLFQVRSIEEAELIIITEGLL